MATLMIVLDPTGHVVGRCDERCYDGAPGRCRCCCGGRNHGAGLRKAARQSLDMLELNLENLPIDPGRCKIKVYKARSLAKWAHPQFPQFDEADLPTTPDGILDPPIERIAADDGVNPALRFGASPRKGLEPGTRPRLRRRSSQ